MVVPDFLHATINWVDGVQPTIRRRIRLTIKE
jgi:hypothetical protein